jgi:hypothetical protein
MHRKSVKFWNEEVFQHMNVERWCNCNCMTIIILEKIRTNYFIRRDRTPDCNFGRMERPCLLTYPMRWKWASSLIPRLSMSCGSSSSSCNMCSRRPRAQHNLRGSKHGPFAFYTGVDVSHHAKFSLLFESKVGEQRWGAWQIFEGFFAIATRTASTFSDVLAVLALPPLLGAVWPVVFKMLAQTEMSFLLGAGARGGKWKCRRNSRCARM